MPNRARTDHAGERDPFASWLTAVILTGVISLCSVFALSACGQGGEDSVPGLLSGPPGGEGTVPGESGGTELGTAAVSWEAPTTNDDGTPLADLAGYKVYYGTSSPLDKSTSPSINVGTATSYTLSGLTAGTYFFAATAYDTLGNESTLSEEVSKVIPGTI